MAKPRPVMENGALGMRGSVTSVASRKRESAIWIPKTAGIVSPALEMVSVIWTTTMMIWVPETAVIVSPS